MSGQEMSDPEAVDPQHLLMIVVGAHLEAELADRPLGYRLQNDVVRWQQETPEADPLAPIVCTDLWYLNARELMLRPTISVGRPEHNAVSAYLANRLPTALVIDRSLQVQLDPEFITLQACVWGVDEPATRSGVDLFVERYLESFLRSAHSL
ncbi:MAG: hypothetical protein ACYSW2_19180 [Planctomycetota bacterium]|jgi:hypothetical protein